MITGVGYWIITKKGYRNLIVGNALVLGASAVLGGLALRFAPQSLVGPFATLTVVWTTLLVSWEGKPIRVFPVVRIVAGCIIMSALATEPTQSRLTPETVLDLLLLTLGVALCSLTVCFLLLSSQQDSGSLPETAPAPEHPPSQQRQLPYASLLALLAGVQGGFTDTNAKAFVTWYEPRSLFALVVSGFAQLVLLNSALGRAPSNRVIPVYTIVFTASVIGLGVLVYHELRNIAPYRVGLMLLVCTVAAQAAYECQRNEPEPEPQPAAPAKDPAENETLVPADC